MKKKLGIRLSEATFQKLQDAAQLPGVSKSAIAEAALARWLDTDIARDDLSNARLDRIEDQLARLEDVLKMVCEIAALHARYHLTVAPLMAEAEHRAACKLGQERFEALADQVGKRVAVGQSLIQETLDRLGAAPALREVDMASPTDHAQRAAETVASPDLVNLELEPPAAVGEGGSNDSFRHLPNAFCLPR
jgi:predicted transcriptional regulator